MATGGKKGKLTGRIGEDSIRIWSYEAKWPKRSLEELVQQDTQVFGQIL